MTHHSIPLRLALVLSLALPLAARAEDHAEHVGPGPFATGPDVTKKCLECHEDSAASFLKSVHWTWSRSQVVDDRTVAYGKKNAINNFCIAVPSNWARCTSCHAGYGWKDDGFDFTRAENIDCLVCHDTSGTYRKFPSGAGHPVYAGETKAFPKGKPWPAVDLVRAAQSVGLPTRAACGSCHFYGGGGDHVKHGDLDSSLVQPTRQVDVHMGGEGMTCVDCHQGDDHDIRGEALSVSTGTGKRTMGCTDCHESDLHKRVILDRHAEKIACQTCHIPSYANRNPTLVWWDWSTAGRDVPPEGAPKDGFGMKTYDRMKGDFRWGRRLTPTYDWFNGTVDRVMLGDTIDPVGVVALSAPQGDRKDPNARIWPFKVMRGKQPYDAERNTMVVVNTFGPDGYWAKYDWDLAIANGQKAAGQPYSGKHGFVETSMVWALNHMVAPKEKALKCTACHGSKSRLDWEALGYPKDPMKKF